MPIWLAEGGIQGLGVEAQPDQGGRQDQTQGQGQCCGNTHLNPPLARHGDRLGPLPLQGAQDPFLGDGAGSCDEEYEGPEDPGAEGHCGGIGRGHSQLAFRSPLANEEAQPPEPHQDARHQPGHDMQAKLLADELCGRGLSEPPTAEPSIPGPGEGMEARCRASSGAALAPFQSFKNPPAGKRRRAEVDRAAGPEQCLLLAAPIGKVRINPGMVHIQQGLEDQIEGHRHRQGEDEARQGAAADQGEKWGRGQAQDQKQDLRVTRHPGSTRGEEKDHGSRSCNPTGDPEFLEIDPTATAGLDQQLPQGAVFELAAEGVGADPEAGEAVGQGCKANVISSIPFVRGHGIHGCGQEREACSGHLSPNLHLETRVCQQSTPFHQQDQHRSDHGPRG